MEPTELLLQLEILEEGLYDFSFDQLTAPEAVVLRQKFEIFKADLSQKIFNESYDYDSEYQQEYDMGEISASEKMQSPISQMTEAIMRLKKTKITEDQCFLIESLELATMILTELTLNKNR